MTYDTVKSLFTAICDAIRDADGTTSKIKHQDIPKRISDLQNPAENALFIPNVTIIDTEYSTINIYMFDQDEIEEDLSWSAE